MGGDALIFRDKPIVESWNEDIVASSVIIEITKKSNVETYLAGSILAEEDRGNAYHS